MSENKSQNAFAKIMQMDRQRRLELLVRQNRGRTEFKTYFDDLELLLNLRIAGRNRIDLETTDQLLIAYSRGLEESRNQPQQHFQKTWPYEPTGPWTSECERIAKALHSEEAVLFIGPYEYCGAVRVALESVLKAVLPLLEFDANSVRMGSSDARCGFYLDKYEEQSKWFVEFVIWGEWAHKLAPILAEKQ